MELKCSITDIKKSKIDFAAGKMWPKRESVDQMREQKKSKLQHREKK